jgi:predicted aminopeptidase
MSALAEALRALMPFTPDSVASFADQARARDVLRKHAPCERCGGTGLCTEMCNCEGDGACPGCSGAGWTPASVETAIAQVEERERLDAAVHAELAAIKRRHLEKAERLKACTCPPRSEYDDPCPSHGVVGIGVVPER